MGIYPIIYPICSWYWVVEISTQRVVLRRSVAHTAPLSRRSEDLESWRIIPVVQKPGENVVNTPTKTIKLELYFFKATKKKSYIYL